MGSRPADTSIEPKASNHGESNIRVSRFSEKRMQGDVTGASGPNKRRRFERGLRFPDTAYAGAA